MTNQEEYIKQLYEKNVNYIYKICFVFFKGNKSDIEDAIQSIFLKVIEKNIIFNDDEHAKAWFIVTTNNYCKNKVKHWWNKNKELDFDIKQEDKEDNTLELILNLPDKYKVPIYMHYYEGYSCIEIAKILKVSENTIYSYLHRGRLLLKDILEEEKHE